MHRESLLSLSLISVFLLLSCFLSMFAGCAAGPRPADNARPLQSGIDELATGLVQSTDTQKAGKIAVLYFIGPDGRLTQFGEHLADKLSVRLFSSKAFSQMLERHQLKQVLNAKKEELSGYFDPNSVKKFGQMLGVDSMVIGTITNMGDSVDVTARVVASATGRILGMSDIRLRKTDAVNSLLKPLFGKLTIQTRPIADGTVVAGDRQIYLSNGSATISNIPYGDCRVSIQADGYDPAGKSVSVYSREQAIAIPLTAKTYTVSFQITPPDATLRVDGETVSLDTDGFAKMSDMLPKEYAYTINAKGYTPKNGRFNPMNTTVVSDTLLTDDPFYGVKDDFFKKVKQAKNARAFKIELWTGQQTYRQGESVVFSFRAERDCYLNLVDINSRGEITLLFPNQYHGGHHIQAGRTYRIPDDSYGFSFQVQPPFGRDRIYAIASDGPIDIFDSNFSASGFGALSRGVTPAAGIRGIGVKLKHARLESADELVINVRP